MSVIRWEDPPTDGRRGRRPSKYWRDIAEQLRGRPGSWARIHSGPRQGGLAQRVKNGKSAFEPAGAYEAREALQDGAWHVYARYVGEPS